MNTYHADIRTARPTPSPLWGEGWGEGIGRPMNDKARSLRKRSTDAEQKLWLNLRNRQLDGHKFRRQHPIGNYIADFVCIEAGLIIEADGGQHAEQQAYDAEGTLHLEQAGYRVLRFWNNQILESFADVLTAIHNALNHPHPAPLPHAGEGTDVNDHE